mgnify:CR=1 FL=1
MNKLLKWFADWCEAHPNRYLNRETVTYLIFGVLTTVVNWVVYYGLTLLGVNYLASQVIAWVAAVIFAYLTNRRYVFQSRVTDAAGVLKEFFLFVGARVLSFLIETLILWLFVEKAGFSELIVKIPASVLTVILNYLFSKLFIFKKKETAEGRNDENET